MNEHTMDEALSKLPDGTSEGMSTEFFKLRFAPEPPPYEMSAKRAVGRVVRAVTYPVCANDYADMTMRELSTLATLAHSNWDAQVGEPLSKEYRGVVDSYDGISMLPGAGQIYFNNTDFANAVAGLVAKELVKVTKVQGFRLLAQGQGEGQFVTLTKKGTELVEAIACNLGKSLSVLEDTATLRELREYAGLE